MSIFSTEDISTQGGTNVSPTAGVNVDKTSLYEGVSNLVNYGLGANDRRLKANKAEQAQTLLGNLNQEFTNIDQALSRDEITASVAKARKSKLSRDAIARGADAQSVKDIASFTIGKEEDLIDPRIKLEDQLIDAAKKGGQVFSYMSREEQLEAGNNYVAQQQALYKLELSQKKQTYSKGDIELDNARNKYESTKALKEFALTSGKSTTYKVNEVLNLLNKNGNTPQARSEAINQLDMLESEVNSAVAGIGAESGLISPLVSPILKRIELGRKSANGLYTKEAYDARVANTLSYQQAMLMSEEGVPQLAAVAKLFDPMVISHRVDNSVIKFLSKNAVAGRTKPVDIMVSTADEAAEPGLGAEIKSNLDTVLTLAHDNIVKGVGDEGGTPSKNKEQVKVEMAKQFDAILNSVGKHGTGEPSEYFAVTQFFAKSDFADVSESLMKELSPEYRKNAVESLTQYGSFAVRSITNNLERETIDGKPVIETFKPVLKTSSNGVTVDLVPREGKSVTPLQLRAAQAIQRRTGRVISDLVRAGAHLQGHRDYKRVFEENYGRLFGEKLSEAK